MAVPSLRHKGSDAQSGVNVNALTDNLVGGAAVAGDLLVVVLNLPTAAAGTTVTWPAGYSVLWDFYAHASVGFDHVGPGSPPGGHWGVAYKVATGGETQAAVTWIGAATTGSLLFLDYAPPPNYQLVSAVPLDATPGSAGAGKPVVGSRRLATSVPDPTDSTTVGFPSGTSDVYAPFAWQFAPVAGPVAFPRGWW
jgi:hypothetical protein